MNHFASSPTRRFRPRAINNDIPTYWVWGSKKSRVSSRKIKLYFKCHNSRPYNIIRTIYFTLPFSEEKYYVVAQLPPGNSIVKHILTPF